MSSIKNVAELRQLREQPLWKLLATVRDFCNECAFSEPLARSTVRETMKAALERWPDLIQASALLPQQKERLLAHFYAVPALEDLARRQAIRNAPSS